MKALTLTTLFIAAAVSTVAFAQSPNTEQARETAQPRVYHAGGKHDQRGHEATLRARARGQRVEDTNVHAGGRHDAQTHKAAIRADEIQREKDAAK